MPPMSRTEPKTKFWRSVTVGNFCTNVQSPGHRHLISRLYYRRSAAVYRRLRCAACLLSRKDCSVMKKINSTNNAEQPRPSALNRWVALSVFGDRRELLHECAKPRPPAPNKNKTNLDENSKFVLFFTRDYFGVICKFRK